MEIDDQIKHSIAADGKPPVVRSWRITGVDFIFAWYDLWIGLFWDKKKRYLYILPLPMIGLIVKFDSHAVTSGNPI